MKLFKLRQRSRPVRLNSKLVRWVLYAPDTMTLTVWPSNGRKTVHRGIPQGVYDNLVSADPPDFYYETYIADKVEQKPAAIRWIVVGLLVLAMILLVWLEHTFR